jgi:hypothetical protein
MVEREFSEVWDTLEKVIGEAPMLLIAVNTEELLKVAESMLSGY